MSPPFQSILHSSSFVVAPRLLGSLLVREVDGEQLVGKIIETEAYDQSDAASHSYNGVTPRTDVMFGPAGHAYVYFTYGMHFCMNIVTGDQGYGAAVLIRALEPLQGLELIRLQRHGIQDNQQLTNGPAKLCQALSIDKKLNGHALNQPPLQLIIKPPMPKTQIVKTTRIGITRDTYRLWRFYIKGSRYVSRT